MRVRAVRLTTRKLLAVSLFVGVLACGQAHATLQQWDFQGAGTFGTVNGDVIGTLQARAIFAVTGDDLEVWLANTYTGHTTQNPGQVLTALFYDVTNKKGDQVLYNALIPVSALLAPPSASDFDYSTHNQSGGPSMPPSSATVINQGQPTGGNLGGEWGYNTFTQADTPLRPDHTTRGISSSGLSGLFGAPNFNGPNLSGPDALDGVQYGLVSSLGESTQNGAMGTPLVKYHTTFLLDGWNPANVGDWKIGNVWFQYGTASNDTNYKSNVTYVSGNQGGGGETAVPEPASCALLALAMGGVVAGIRRRRAA
jgi:hypothetical protein